MTNIYIITNILNRKQYVGKTIHSIHHRFEQHCNDTNNTYIDSAIKKYGRENFKVELLMKCPDDEWQYWEKHFIQCMHTHWTEGGYNLSRGGDENPMSDPKVREKHLEAVRNPERLRKIAESARGRRHSEESKHKMSRIQKELYRNNIELRNKVKMNQPSRISVNMLDGNGNIIRKFDSLSDACRFFGKSNTNAGRLKECIDSYNKNGNRSKFWGYSWSYDKECVETRDVVVS